MSCDPKVAKWLETAGTFENPKMLLLYSDAYADFYGKDIGGFDMWFMFELDDAGYEPVWRDGVYRLERVRE